MYITLCTFTSTWGDKQLSTYYNNCHSSSGLILAVKSISWLAPVQGFGIDSLLISVRSTVAVRWINLQSSMTRSRATPSQVAYPWSVIFLYAVGSSSCHVSAIHQIHPPAISPSTERWSASFTKLCQMGHLDALLVAWSSAAPFCEFSSTWKQWCSTAPCRGIWSLGFSLEEPILKSIFNKPANSMAQIGSVSITNPTPARL